MSVEYRTKLIRRAVDANTSPNVAATALQARTLHKYFESPQCADIAYMKIIERGEWAVSGLAAPGAGGTIVGNSMLGNTVVGGSGNLGTIGDGSVNGLDNSSSGGTVTGGPALGKIGAFHSSSISGHKGSGVGDGGDKVLVKCVRLLKTYLLVYYPSDYVLVALDRFCFRMQSIFEEAAKSFEYVRALVEAISQSRHTPLSNATTPTSTNQNPSSLDSPILSHTPSNSHHFNTAPSSVLSSISLHHSSIASNPMAAGTQLSPKSLHASTGVPGSINLSHSNHTNPGTTTSPLTSPLNNPSEHPAAQQILTANFIASRVRPFVAEPLDSLLCSSIFGGRIPTALLDIFAERTEATTKIVTSGTASTTGSNSGGNNGNSASVGAGMSVSGPSSASGKVESSASKSSSKSSHNHAAQAYLFSLPDQDLRERIATVSLSKKMEERAMYKSFRRGQPLFQYKHYIEQVKLDLNASQIDAIVSAMIQSTHHESRLLASKIMIKLIMDMYCQDSIELASSSLLSVLLELIQFDQPVDTKIHAFNLIFNLSTHLHMFEEVSFFNGGTPPSSTSSTQTPNPSSLPPHASPLRTPHQSHPPLLHPNLQGSTPTINKIQNELFSIVKELLLALVQQRETNRKLWFSGLSCLLYFMTNTGLIDKEKLIGLDPRVIAAFFKNLDYINDSVWRHLVRILVNRLYLDSSRMGKKALIPTHDFIAQILLLGQSPTSVVSSNLDPTSLLSTTPFIPSPNKEGIRFIVDLYKRSRSMESKDNLFHVIFDYIHYCYRRMIRTPGGGSISLKPKGNDGKTSHSSTGTQFSYILEILTRIDAPQYFASIFKYPPPNFVNHVVGLINHVANNAGPEFTQLLHQTDPIILRRVLKDFASLADLTLKLAPPWSQDCMEILDDTANTVLLTSSLKQITSMIQGKASMDASNHMAIQFERQHGSQWMVQLMQIVWNVRLGLAHVPQVESRRHSNPPPSSLSSGSAASGPSLGAPGSMKGRARKESNSSAGSAATISTTSSHRRPSRDAGRESHRTARESTKDSKEPKESLGHSETESHSGASSASSATAHTSPNTSFASASGVSATDSKESPKEPKDRDVKDHHAKDHKDHKDSVTKDSSPHSTSTVTVNLKDSHTSSAHKDSTSKETSKTTSKHHTPTHLSIPTVGDSEASLLSNMQRLPTRGLHLRTADASFVDLVESTFFSHAKSSDPLVRRSFLKVVESGMFYISSLSDQGASHTRGGSASVSPNSSSGNIPRSPRPTSVLLDADVLSKKSFEMLNSSLLKLIKLGQEQTEANLQLMFDIIMQFVCLLPISNRIYPFSYHGSNSTLSAANPTLPTLAEFPTSPKTRISTTISPPTSSHSSRKEPVSSTMKQAARGGHPGASGAATINTGTTAGPSPANDFNLSDSDESLGSDEEMPFGSISGMRAAAEKKREQQQPPSPQIERLLGGDGNPGGMAGMNTTRGSSNGGTDGLDMVDLNNQDDSPAGLFMRGKLDIVRPLLDQIDIEILLHIFNHLPPRMNSATRPVALHFLTERCKHNPSDLDAVGGSSFFKKLLMENDPLISYLASRFLIDKLQKEQPENFNMVVNTLLAKAVDLNDEKLVSNPYLQIKAIFEMNSTLRRKEQGGLFPL